MAADPFWYQTAIIYQVHVRAFFDSNNDGIGDFRGLTQKLGYIRDLGVTALWLLPFYPSPLRDDGYDIADYCNTNSIYGTLEDFKEFLDEAHQLDLRVITELVLNHTSDQHVWFQRSRRAPAGSRWRDYYVWSNTPEKYQDARVIFKDFEPSNWTYDPIARAYFWHRFYSHQPDLNFDNPEVQEALLECVDFWLELGVDGLRLDAVPYLYEREGTTCENLPETHAFLQKLRAHVDARFHDRMLLAEANQWPEDAIAYFGNGDECQIAFHFPLMPRMYMALAIEDRIPVIDILQQTPDIPDSCQWAVFLRNHDELTLEMVTDEERDYMYRFYAHERRARLNLGIRRRLAPLMGNDRRKIELINGLLFTLPGTPVMYYGDEIGMGDNIYLGDRNGVRTPLQWSPDRNAGFSTANSQSLFLPVIIDSEYHYEALNIESQQANANSLLWWMKRMISLRKQHLALSRGKLTFLNPENRKVLAFIRQHGTDIILIVANLSRLAQFVELDLNDYQGFTPNEMFGQTAFPSINSNLYNITLTPYSLYLFTLERTSSEKNLPTEETLPQIQLTQALTKTLASSEEWFKAIGLNDRLPIENALRRYLRRCLWYRGRDRRPTSVTWISVLPLQIESAHYLWTELRVESSDGESEIYSLPLGLILQDNIEVYMQEHPRQAIARILCGSNSILLIDASQEKCYNLKLTDLILHRIHLRSEKNLEMIGTHNTQLDTGAPFQSIAAIRGEHHNVCMNLDGKWLLKHLRRLEDDLHPEVEIIRFLTEKTQFRKMPLYLGMVEVRTPLARAPIAILQSYIAHQGDAQTYTLDFLGGFFEGLLTSEPVDGLQLPRSPLLKFLNQDLPITTHQTFHIYLQNIERMAETVARLHEALASTSEDADFSPEPYSALSRRSYYQGLRSLTDATLMLLENQRLRLTSEEQEIATELLATTPTIHQRLRRLLDEPHATMRIRTHGDLQLNHILFVGTDLMIVDFAGEHRRSISQRRLKQPPIRDVAAMLYSLQEVALMALNERVVRAEDRGRLIPWARYWYSWTQLVFLRSYSHFNSMQKLTPLESTPWLLNLFLLEKALYELRTALREKPASVRTALILLQQLLGEPI